MMLAVSSRVPMIRTSCASGDSSTLPICRSVNGGSPVVGNSDFVVFQLELQDEHRHDEVHLPVAIARALNGQHTPIVNVPILHPLPDPDADIDALWKALIETQEAALPLANLVHRRRCDLITQCQQFVTDSLQL